MPHRTVRLPVALTLSAAGLGVLLVVALPSATVPAGATVAGPVESAPPAAPAAPTVLPAAPARTPAVPARTPTVPPAASGTGWSALDGAVARIPGYALTLPAQWSSRSSGRPWGRTTWPTDTVTVSRSTPAGRLDAVVRHEWSHVLQDRAYGHDTAALLADTDRVFGGTGTGGAERAADCMARLLGATWTHYTACDDARWRAGAQVLLAGHRLPRSY